MVLRFTLFLLVLSCSGPRDTAQRSGVDTAAFGLGALVKPPAPTPREIAQLRGAAFPDRIDSLLARVLAIDGEFGEADGDPPAFYYSGQSDTSLGRLAMIPEALPRLVDCLGWDRRSRSTWHAAPLLVGAVCGHVLRATPYVQSRQDAEPWIDYENPTIGKLRSIQAKWRKQLPSEAR